MALLITLICLCCCCCAAAAEQSGNSVDVFIDSQTRTVTVSGAADGGAQALTLYVLKPGARPETLTPEQAGEFICAVEEFETEADGTFRHSLKLPADAPGGTYTVVLGQSATMEPLSERSAAFYYATADEVEAALQAVSGATSGTIAQVMDQYLVQDPVLNASTELYAAYTRAADTAEAAFVAIRDEAGIKEISSIEEFISLFEQAVGLASFCTVPAGELADAFDRYGDCLGLDLQTDYESAKAEVHTAFSYVRGTVRIRNLADMRQAYRTALAIGVVNSTTRDKIAETLTKYRDVFGLEQSAIDKADPSVVGKALAHMDFTSVEEVKTAFDKAADETSGSGTNGNSGGSYSGGGSSGGSSGSRTKMTATVQGGSTVTGPGPAQQPPAESKPGTSVFTDLNEVGEWAHESIVHLAELGVINGMEDGRFAPNAEVTREEFVKMLMLAFGLSASQSSAQFRDVAQTDWFYPYVISAAELGIVQGIDGSAFGVGRSITRQEMAVMAYRTLTYTGVSLDGADQPSGFADGDQIADYAAESVSAMYNAGIINGVGDGMFAPDDHATRAQAAKVINGLLQLH